MLRDGFECRPEGRLLVHCGISLRHGLRETWADGQGELLYNVVCDVISRAFTSLARSNQVENIGRLWVVRGEIKESYRLKQLVCSSLRIISLRRPNKVFGLLIARLHV